MSTISQADGRRSLVRRASLFQRLSSVPPGGVALVAGPAGSGKTLLLSSWALTELSSERVAWVSVGRDEHDPHRFWQAVIDQLAALGAVDPVTPSPGFRGPIVVERLIADLSIADEPVVLVLDDLHELQADEALRSLDLLLARLPPGLRLVLGTREQPAVGLHRLRVEGRLVELSADDLRFSLEETRELLASAGVTLSDAGVRALHEKTEGWAAGLRLAAISLAGRADPERFVTEFSGTERTVAGYLLAEVLDRRPAEVRDLLLRTSVVERVTGPLADALTGREGSEGLLQELEDANAFITALDPARTTFRYHHLFGDLLRLELRRAEPALVGPLHRTAARWHEEHGEPVEAIRHAQAAGDWAHAGRLLTDHYGRLFLQGRLATLRMLLDAFPAGAAESDPEVALACGAMCAFDGRLDEGAAHVAAAERLHRTVRDDRRWFFGLRRAVVKLLVARRRGDLAAAIDELDAIERAVADGREPRSARELALGNDLRAASLMNLGTAELWSARFEDGRRHLEDAVELARRGGLPYLEIGCLAHLAMLAPLTGLPLSMQLGLAQQAVEIAEAHGWTTDPMAGAAFAVGGEGLVRLGRLGEAERWLARADRALAPEEPETAVLLHGARALLRFAQGRPDEALGAFRAAQRMQAMLLGEHAFAVELDGRALQALVSSGDVARARATLSALDERSRTRASMRLAAAAVHLADDRPEAALAVVEPVIAGAVEALHPAWAAVDAALFAAAAHEQLGDRRAVEDRIELALGLSAPDALVLPFLLAPARAALERHPRYRTRHPVELARILDVLAGAPPSGVAPADHDLSDAELRVVAYLPSNLKAPEIAAELFLSANTVRTHLRHIYAKLDAHSRSEAVARARALGLLTTGNRA